MEELFSGLLICMHQAQFRSIESARCERDMQAGTKGFLEIKCMEGLPNVLVLQESQRPQGPKLNISPTQRDGDSELKLKI